MQTYFFIKQKRMLARMCSVAHRFGSRSYFIAKTVADGTYIRKPAYEIYKLKRPKMMVFDMDGTTIRTNKKGMGIYDQIHSALVKYNVPVERSEIDNFRGIEKKEVITYFVEKRIPNRVKDIDIINNHLNNTLIETYSDRNNISFISDKLPDLFEKWRAKDIIICLNTGYPIDVQKQIIRTLDMQNMVDGYVSSEHVKHGRPYPYMINRLMDQFMVANSKHVWKIGDSVADINEGRNANVGKVFGVLSGGESRDKLSDADFVIKSIDNLDNYIC